MNKLSFHVLPFKMDFWVPFWRNEVVRTRTSKVTIDEVGPEEDSDENRNSGEDKGFLGSFVCPFVLSLVPFCDRAQRLAEGEHTEREEQYHRNDGVTFMTIDRLSGVIIGHLCVQSCLNVGGRGCFRCRQCAFVRNNAIVHRASVSKDSGVIPETRSGRDVCFRWSRNDGRSLYTGMRPTRCAGCRVEEVDAAIDRRDGFLPAFGKGRGVSWGWGLWRLLCFGFHFHFVFLLIQIENAI